MYLTRPSLHGVTWGVFDKNIGLIQLWLYTQFPKSNLIRYTTNAGGDNSGG